MSHLWVRQTCRMGVKVYGQTPRFCVKRMAPEHLLHMYDVFHYLKQLEDKEAVFVSALEVEVESLKRLVVDRRKWVPLCVAHLGPSGPATVAHSSSSIAVFRRLAILCTPALSVSRRFADHSPNIARLFNQRSGRGPCELRHVRPIHAKLGLPPMNIAQTWPNPGRRRRNLAEFEPNASEFRPSSTNFGHFARNRPNLGCARHMLGSSGLDQDLPGNDQHWPGIHTSWSDFGQSWSELGRSRPRIGQRCS